MRRLILLAALLLMLHPGALAADPAEALLEKAGLSDLESLSESLGGPDVREAARAVLSGELPIDRDLPALALRQLCEAVKVALLPALSVLAVPVLAALSLGMVLGADSGPLTLLCRLSAVYGLGRQCAAAMAVARSGMSVAVRIADTAAPVVAAALTLTGRAAAGATLTPLSAICADAVGNALVNWGLALCGVAAIVAAGGNLSGRFRLDGLFRLICRAITWGVGMLIAAFVGVMALQGRLAATRDGASSQALRQALRGMIPLIGGSVSDSSGTLAETAVAVRGAVGATGLLIVLGTAADPALKLGANMLSLKLASALLEPVADPGIARIAACYGEIARVLLALYAGSVMLTALLAGAGLGLLGF
jgi:stage III sporulation protein AE